VRVEILEDVGKIQEGDEWPGTWPSRQHSVCLASGFVQASIARHDKIVKGVRRIPVNDRLPSTTG
jgi:hypothetical protein